MRRTDFIPAVFAPVFLPALICAMSGCTELPLHSALSLHGALPGESGAHAAGTPPLPGEVSISLDAERLAGIKVASVGLNSVEESVKTTGEVLADANLVTHVVSPVAGRVTEVLALLGQKVEQGKPVLRVRSADVEEAEAQLLQQDAEIKADLKKDLLQIDSDIAISRAQLDLSQKTFARAQSLLDEKIASRADFEGAQTQNQKDQIALDSLLKKRDSTLILSGEKLRLVTEPIKQRLLLLGVPENEIEKTLTTRKIAAVVPVYAPETGIVCDRQVNVGELVDNQKILLTIGDFHKVWLKADIFEKDIARLKKGQSIELDVDSFPGEKFHGKLDYLADSVNPDTRTWTVRAEVANPGDKLKPKMFARMTIQVGHKTVLTVPNTAVQDAGSDKVVYVALAPGKYEERKVKLGKACKDYIEVVKGLQQGEKIAVSGTFQLRSQSISQSSN
jgi:membrane fusion protein, heavy metal efflux system